MVKMAMKIIIPLKVEPKRTNFPGFLCSYILLDVLFYSIAEYIQTTIKSTKQCLIHQKVWWAIYYKTALLSAHLTQVRKSKAEREV